MRIQYTVYIKGLSGRAWAQRIQNDNHLWYGYTGSALHGDFECI